MHTPGAFSRSFAPPPARARWWLAIGVLLAVPLLALAVDVGWRMLRWNAELKGVRFIDHPEKIRSDNAAVTVSGYLVATVASDVDFFALARKESAQPKVEATLCESDRPLDNWYDPLPRESQGGPRPYRYAVLVPLRGRDVDLARTNEEVCLRFRAATNNPLSWVRSRPVVVRLAPALREELAAYGRRGAPVELTLDPGCAPHLCEPGFVESRLRP
ncbi:MAG TPA: hypothetical protein VF453_07330 [Burkholderiaceae bacterium]